ncbi:hypothetical protein ABW20_dc0106903 [Dactylellina cionopaga]|nr:hypothetical protein ABW20_dc0106903 [Dactylellina cionopaga]
MNGNQDLPSHDDAFNLAELKQGLAEIQAAIQTQPISIVEEDLDTISVSAPPSSPNIQPTQTPETHVDFWRASMAQLLLLRYINSQNRETVGQHQCTHPPETCRNPNHWIDYDSKKVYCGTTGRTWLDRNLLYDFGIPILPDTMKVVGIARETGHLDGLVTLILEYNSSGAWATLT